MHTINSVQAADRLKLPYDKFIEYVRSGLICYKLVGKERLYTAQELTRFKKEVLNQPGSKL